MNARHRSLLVVIIIGWLLVACGASSGTQTIVVTVIVTPTVPPPLPPATTPARPTPVTPTQPPLCVAWNIARNFVGQNKCVCGPVVRTNYVPSTKGQPTYLDIGVAYPDPQRLSVIIWSEHRAAFPWPPEQHYRGLNICAAGNITLYKDVPQVEVTAPSQIRELP